MLNALGRRRGSGLGVPSLVAAAALLLAACGNDGGIDTTSPEAEGETSQETTDDDQRLEDDITLNVGTLWGPGHWQVTPLESYAAAVEQASDGAIKFEFHYGDSLVGPLEYPSALEAGLLDIAPVITNYTPDLFPIDNWIAQSGFLGHDSPPVSVLNVAAATLDWAFSNEEMMDEFRNNGLEPLLPRFQFYDNYDLLCRESPVRTLDEASGVRVRAPGPTWVSEAEALGMSAEVIPGQEVYEAFQRGVLDCVMGAPPDLMAIGVDEIGEHYTDTSFTGFSGYGLLMSADTWNGLSDAATEIMWENLPIYWEEIYTNYLLEQTTWVLDGVEAGMEFHQEGDDFAQALDEYHEAVLDSMLEDAPTTLDNPQEALDDAIARHNEWERILVDELGYESGWASWKEWVEEAGSDEIDLNPWAERVTSDVLDRHRP